MEEIRKKLRDLKNELERDVKTMTSQQVIALVDAIIQESYDVELVSAAEIESRE